MSDRSQEPVKDAQTAYEEGLAYYHGVGAGEQSGVKAAQRFRLAAEQGYARAQDMLGYLYYTGYGVVRSEAEAAKWFQLAADQGEAGARHYLDVMRQATREGSREAGVTPSPGKRLNAPEPGEFLRRYGVRCFFHFTDIRNVVSIEEFGGLLCLAELRRRGITVPAPGGNEWSHDADAMFGLDEFVHLCFLPEHPMEYVARQQGRILQSRFLEIDPAVLRNDGIRFSADIANKHGVPILTFAEAHQIMDFAVVYERLDWHDPAVRERRQLARKYELLVPGQVPLHLIRGL